MIAFIPIEYILVFLFALYMLACLATWRLRRYRRKQAKVLEFKTTGEHINHIFKIIWNGEDSDELYAWYRTRAHIENFVDVDDTQRSEMLNMVNNMIRKIRKQQITRTHLTPNGKLIKITQSN